MSRLPRALHSVTPSGTNGSIQSVPADMTCTTRSARIDVRSGVLPHCGTRNSTSSMRDVEAAKLDPFDATRSGADALGRSRDDHAPRR